MRPAPGDDGNVISSLGEGPTAQRPNGSDNGSGPWENFPSLAKLVKYGQIMSNPTIIEGSLEVKLPTWTDEKQSRAEAERRERSEERRVEEKESEEKRCRCEGKSRNTVFFQ